MRVASPWTWSTTAWTARGTGSTDATRSCRSCKLMPREPPRPAPPPRPLEPRRVLVRHLREPLLARGLGLPLGREVRGALGGRLLLVPRHLVEVP